MTRWNWVTLRNIQSCHVMVMSIRNWPFLKTTELTLPYCINIFGGSAQYTQVFRGSEKFLLGFLTIHRPFFNRRRWQPDILHCHDNPLALRPSHPKHHYLCHLEVVLGSNNAHRKVRHWFPSHNCPQTLKGRPRPGRRVNWTHCHLDYPRFTFDFYHIIALLPKKLSLSYPSKKLSYFLSKFSLHAPSSWITAKHFKTGLYPGLYPSRLF